MLQRPVRRASLLVATFLTALLSADAGPGGGGGGGGNPYQLASCTAPFEDISGTGTPLGLSDRSSSVVSIFPFRYWGTLYNQVSVSSNGYLQFGGSNNDFSNDPIPSTNDPDNLICPLWDDWNPTAGGEVYVQVRGNPPNRRFIAQWDQVPHFDAPNPTATFQAVLYEGSNRIEFHYGPLVQVSPSVGIENADGSQGISVALVSVGDGACVAFLTAGEGSGTELECEEFNRFADLTPNDTLTVFTKQHNPQQEQGYYYVYAVSSTNNTPIAFDGLIGHQLVFDGVGGFQYAVNPVDYRAGAGLDRGDPTDSDSDGIRDLDGTEYEKTAGELLVPRFIGADPGRMTGGELILIGLSGGARFNTTVDFFVYNDDEDQFSAQHTFRCWDKRYLTEISSVFENQFLKYFSGSDPTKSLGALEYGWFRVFGDVASSTFFDLHDPAVYAVYVERVGAYAAGDLPFEICSQSGHLLPRGLGGDNSETNGSQSDQDCAEDVVRRLPGSLLLFPEFDNRMGNITVSTVTNVNGLFGVRIHYLYIGRYGV